MKAELVLSKLIMKIRIFDLRDYKV